MKWNNCLLVFDKKSGKFTDQVEYLSNQDFRIFFNRRKNNFTENVWVDLEGESTALWGGTEAIKAKPILEENHNDVKTAIDQLNDLLDVEFVLVDTPQDLTLRIVGRHQDDFGVLQLAYAFEQSTGFWKRKPAIVE